MTSNDDALRARLAQFDPAPVSLPVDSSTNRKAQELVERVMQTAMQEAERGTPRWRKPAALAAAAAVVVALGVGAVVVRSGNDGTAPKAKTTLALRVGGSGTSMQSCIPFSVDVLRDFPVAFGATVTSLDETTVTLAVDQWYRGGTADIVTLAQTPGNVSLDGVEFALGKHYLITASDGTVTSCGFSGESTPDLQHSFAEAFG